MSTFRGWRAWCWNGEEVAVYTSGETSWADVPQGVVGVVLYLDPPYRKVIDGHDWIWVDGGEFRHVSTHPEWGEWMPAPEGVEPAQLKRGVGMPLELWRDVRREMMEARTWP